MKNGLLSLILLIHSPLAFGQGKYDANWVFGENAGINFSDTAEPANFYTLSNTSEFTACISDSFGNLLFYIAPDSFYPGGSQGRINAIYGANNNIISNGDNINEGQGLNFSIFLPIPQTKNEFYVFYSHDYSWVEDSLYYSKIIWDGSKYTVVEKNTKLSAYPLEWRMAAVKHANGNDWWMLFHAEDTTYPTNTFYEYLVTKDSILGPFQQNIGSLHQSLYSFFAQMTFSKNGDWLAVALGDANGVDLFNFDRCTGQLQNFKPLTDIDPANDDQIVACEFSPDGSKLYVSEGDDDFSSLNALYQYSLNDTNIAASQVILWYSDSSQTTFADLLRAPNNKIYLDVNFENTEPNNHYTKFNQYLWVVNEPDSFGTACNFEHYGYYLGDSGRTYVDLPCIPNYNLGALSIYQGGAGVDTIICYSDSITIGNVPVANVNYAWQPAKGITNTNLAQQTLIPDSSMWYYVTLTDTTINFSCNSITDSVYVKVVRCCDSLLLSQCTLSKDTFICTDIDTPTKGATLSVDTVSGVSFTWQAASGISIHSTRQIVDPPQSTWYYVTFFSDSDSASACNQRKDSVYVKVEKCDTMGIQNIALSTAHLSIYPNPAQNTATIEWQSDATTDMHILIYNLLGNEVMDVKAASAAPFVSAQGDKRSAMLDISGLQNGMYIVRLLSCGMDVGEGKLGVVR